MSRDENCKASGNLPLQYGSCWYFTRKELEDISRSRNDGIDSQKESELRMCYCSFLKDFGIRLSAPQVTIATAILFCHRFYLHQSHARNDWKAMATVCMFLASKVEDTPLSLDKVVIAAYEMIYRRDPSTARRIHQKDVFEKQKAVILTGERLLLSTIRFDFNIQHPYRPLLHALKKFGITQKDVRQVAWNFVNDSLQTTLCLQYKPHYIAAGSVFLAAKLHNVKLPSEKGSVWWHEFDVTPKQLHEAIQDMMELQGYKKKPVVTSTIEKPTPTALAVKKESSSSPESCILSRLDPSKSSSRQAGGQRPADIIVPKITDNLTKDDQQTCKDGGAKLPCQATHYESPDSIVEDCQGSGVHVEKATMKSLKVPEIEGRLRSGQYSEKTRAGQEAEKATRTLDQDAPIRDWQKTADDVVKAAPKREEFVDTKDCKILENTIQALTEPKQAAHCKGVDLELEQAINSKAKRQHTEGLNQARVKPEQVVSCEVSQPCDEHVDQATTELKHVEDMLCQQRAMEVDQPKVRPEKVLSCEVSQASVVCVDQARAEPDQVEDRLCQQHGEDANQERVKPEQFVSSAVSQASGERVDQTRADIQQGGDKLCQQQNEEAIQARENTEQPNNEVNQASGEPAGQATVKPGKSDDRLFKIDRERIKSLMKRKREVDAKKRMGAVNGTKSEFSVKAGNGVDQAIAKLEQVANNEVSYRSASSVNQKRAKHEEDGHPKIDMGRIKALMMRRKRERETDRRTKVMNNSTEDTWIERELEAGVELTSGFSLKKQKLA